MHNYNIIGFRRLVTFREWVSGDPEAINWGPHYRVIFSVPDPSLWHPMEGTVDSLFLLEVSLGLGKFVWLKDPYMGQLGPAPAIFLADVHIDACR